MNAFLVIGFIGVLVLVVGFVMNQVAIWKPSDFEYDFINLIGGLLLLWYSVAIWSLPFVILFVVWSAFSLKDCIIDVVELRKLKAKKK